MFVNLMLVRAYAQCPNIHILWIHDFTRPESVVFRRACGTYAHNIYVPCVASRSGLCGRVALIMFANRRTNAHNRLPRMWDAVSPILDQAMVETFAVSRMDALNFVIAYRRVLSLWIHSDLLQVHEDALRKDVDPPPEQLSAFLKSCRLGAVLFADAATRLGLIRFVGTVKAMLHTLEDHHYSPDE